MGHGIAQVCARAEIATVLYDVYLSAVDNGPKLIRADLDAKVSAGDLSETEHDTILAHIQRSSDLALAVQGAQLIIEATPESMDIKRDLFRRVEQRVGELTSEVVRESVVEFVEEIGKDPILVRDSAGFACSRLGIVVCMEAIRMVELSVTRPADIDKAMVLSYGHPIGPLRLADMIGLDVQLEAATHICETLGSEAFRPPELLERRVAEGKLGRKSGEGFYKWRDFRTKGEAPDAT